MVQASLERHTTLPVPRDLPGAPLCWELHSPTQHDHPQHSSSLLLLLPKITESFFTALGTQFHYSNYKALIPNCSTNFCI